MGLNFRVQFSARRQRRYSYVYLTTIILLTIQINAVISQTYRFDKSSEIAIGSGIIALGLIDLKLQSDLGNLSESDISNLDPDQVWKVDRFATDLRSLQADRWSDYTHYTSIALPLMFLATKKQKGELPIIGLMLAETIGLNLTITMFSKNVIKRERPLTYNDSVSLVDKQNRSARQSFISGHSSNAAAFGFFTAKVFSDLYPQSKWKPVVWVAGATLPAVVGALRVSAGKHFLTDVISGYGVGALIGYLIPMIHKRDKASRIHIDSGLNNSLSLRINLN